MKIPSDEEIQKTCFPTKTCWVCARAIESAVIAKFPRCSCDRGEECDRLAEQVKNQAETILDYRCRMREARKIAEGFAITPALDVIRIIEILTINDDKHEEAKA